jgi:hypothetical protein
MARTDLAPVLENILRLVAPRRISVQLGDIDSIYEPVNTVLGKKQRLQALCHYYEAITGAAAGNNVTEAYTNCLAYFRRKRETTLGAVFANDAGMEADLQAQVRQFILQGNALPAVGAESRIRVPGALTFSATNDLGAGGIADGTALPSVRYNDEQALWNANPALGKIPLLLTVEKQVGGAWVPSPNDWVHIQLIPPFHDAAANELNDLNALRNQSLQGPPPGAAVAAGPRQFITDAIQHSFDATDPQRYNAHSSRGGKRGNPVLANIFDALPNAKFPGINAPEVSPAPRKHSVRVQTNAAGAAGVMFMPSGIGGDRYRMRIFLDPVRGLPSSGTGLGAVAQETGRFVVFKHVLWSNYLPKPAPTFPALNSVSGVQARLAVLGYDVGPIDNLNGLRTRAAVEAFQQNYPPLPHNGHWNHHDTQTQLDLTVTEYLNGGGALYVRGVGPSVGAFDYGYAEAQFGSMYCELEIEQAVRNATPMTEVQWHSAFLWARQQAQSNQAAYGLHLVRNVSQMFRDNFETPYLFEICHPRHYNRRRGHGVPAAAAANNHRDYWQDAAQIIYADGGLLQLFLRYLTGGASTATPPTANLTRYSTPGLTVVPAIAASRLFAPPTEPGQVNCNIGNHWGCQASGIATKERACAVFGGSLVYANWCYMPDGYTKNALHEMGHTLYLRHQFTGNELVPGVSNWLHAGANFREDHDSKTTVVVPSTIPPPVVYDRCLMGYLPCEGAFCGKCHLKIRGWDISQMPV